MHFPDIRTRFRSAAILLMLVGTVAVTTTATAEPGVDTAGACPAVYALGVQGSEEGSVATGSDTGALGQLFGPVAAAAGALVQRAYVPYGHSDDGTTLSYEAAVDDAARRLEDMAGEILTRCPSTLLAVAGYAHGAASAAQFAEQVGAGNTRINPDQVAAVALLANPSRTAATAVLPGLPQSTTPSAAPGTTGTQVSKITLLNPTLTGAGIAAAGDSAVDFGKLIGRVADLCVAGDATCDTPSGSPLATAAANIAARTETGDPIAAISTIANALAATVFTTAVGVVNEDLSGTSLDQLSYQPTKTLGQRVAEASDPATTPPSQTDALGALFKLGTIGLNAAITVARTVITPATVAELATVGMTDPLAAVAILGAKLAGAVVELIPPQTASRWIEQAYTAITSTVTEPEQLYTLAGTAQYSDTSGRHGSYDTVSAATSGSSTLRTVANWFIAVARDVPTATTSQSGGSTTSPPRSTSTAPPTPRSSPTTPAAPSTGQSPATTGR